MKYIRTKDGKIFEVEKDLGKYGKSKVVIICDFNGNFIDVEKQNMILKQADTIKELCDEFVVVYEGGARIVYGDLEWAKIKAKESLKLADKSIIYGAIWVSGEHNEPILKSVAKMNEEGTLELL